MSLIKAAFQISRDISKGRETDRLLEQAKARKAAEEEQAKADAAAAEAKRRAAAASQPAAAPPSAYGVPKFAPIPNPMIAVNKALEDKMKEDQVRLAAQQQKFIQEQQTKQREMAMQKEKEMAMQKEKEMAMQKDMSIKAMAPGQVGGMIGGPSKEMGANVGVIGQGLSQNLLPVSNNTMFGNIAVKEGGAPSPYAKMAEKSPEGVPPSQYGAAKPPTGPPAAPGTYGTAKPLTGPVPGGAYGEAKIAEKGPAPVGAYGAPQAGMIGGKIGVDLPKPMEPPKVMEQIKKGEMPTGIANSVPPAEYGVAKGPAPMMKQDAVKAMAPGQMGGMIGGAAKIVGGDVKMIGQGLAAPERNAPDIKKMLEDKKENLPEAIAKKVDPEVKKIVDSFGKPESSQVEQKKMEVMKKMGVEPPKDAKDMEDLRKGIYRPDGKEIPGTALFESFKKDLAAFASMLMKLVGGNQSGYTSGEMFGSTNSLIMIALVVAIVFASRR